MNQPADDVRIQQLFELTRDVQGWLVPDTARLLYRLTRHQGPFEHVVELGSWRGLSAIWLAAGLKDRGIGKLFAVDTWGGSFNEALHQQLLVGYSQHQLYHEFLANIARCGVSEVVEPMYMTTAEAAMAWSHGRSIGLLHIDASHEYEHVLQDFELWTPYVKANGLIIFDDVPSWAGPSRLITELPPWYRVVATPPNKWIVQKLG
jgi:MMP 1-O-methyltransferase